MKKTILVLMLTACAVFAQTEARTAPTTGGEVVDQIQTETTTQTTTSDQGDQVTTTETTETTEEQAPATCMGGGGIMSFLPMIAIIAIFYFLMIRPQQKQAKMLRQMREALKKDDRVVTGGGIHGVITNLKGDVVTIRIADKVKIDVDRNSLQLEDASTE